MNNLLDNFGTNCFSEKNLKNRVPDYVVKKFFKSIKLLIINVFSIFSI